MVYSKLDKLIGQGAQADVYAVGDKAVKVFKEHCSKTEVFYEALINSVVEGLDLRCLRFTKSFSLITEWPS